MKIQLAKPTHTQINFNKFKFTIHGNMQGSKEPKQHYFNFNITFKNQFLQSSWNFVSQFTTNFVKSNATCNVQQNTSCGLVTTMHLLHQIFISSISPHAKVGSKGFKINHKDVAHRCVHTGPLNARDHQRDQNVLQGLDIVPFHI